jgi:hypothetical protein
VSSEHGAIGILVGRQSIRARFLRVGLRGRKTLRRGSDVTSVNLSVQNTRISTQDGYIYRYDGQCTIICTAFGRECFKDVGAVVSVASQLGVCHAHEP